jgi:hypothetical protein
MACNVAIIILNWNGLSDTIGCLESLKEITYPDYTVIVVDNGSSGNDANVLEEKFSDHIQLIRNDKNYGFAEGNNIGIRHALEKSNPQYILLLNNDTMVDPCFIDEFIKVAESDTTIGVLGPKIYYHHEPQKIWFAGGTFHPRIGQAFHTGINHHDNGRYDTIREVAFITGCAMLIKIEVIKKIGLLDSDYFAYHEDSDFCFRARRAGYKLVFVPQSKIWHKVASTLGLTSFPYVYFIARNRIILMRKNASKLNIILFFTPYFIVVKIIKPLLNFTTRRNWRAIHALFLGTRDGLFHNWGEPRWNC